MPIVQGRSRFAQVPDSTRMGSQTSSPSIQGGDGFNDDEGFFIRSLYAGPIVISDPGQDGLYIEMVPNEVMDLSHEDVTVLKRSPALKRAMYYGWIERITMEQYNYLFEYQTQMSQMQEIQRQQDMMRVEGAMLDDYNIDLGRGEAGKAHHYSGGFGYTYNPYAQQQQPQSNTMSLAAMQQNQINNPYVFAKNAAAARQQGIDPLAYAEMVRTGQVQAGNSRMGTRVPLTQPMMQQPMIPGGLGQPMDQITMTHTAATYGVPDGMGSVSPNSAPMGNFNFQAQIPGAMGNQFSARDQAPMGAFPRPMPQQMPMVGPQRMPGFQQPGMMPQMPMPQMMPMPQQMGYYQQPMPNVAMGDAPTEELNLAEDDGDYNSRKGSPYAM